MMDMYAGTPATAGQQPRTPAEFLAALLQATLNARKIQAIVAYQFDGPQVQVFRCSLGLGEDPASVERLSGALAQAAGAAEARISRGLGCLWIEVPKPESERQVLQPSRLAGLKPPTSWHVPLGVGVHGEVVWFDIVGDPRHAHLCIGGTTGSGKTVALHWLLACWLRQNPPAALRLILCDPKASELTGFARSAHLLHPVEHRPAEIAKLLAWARAEMDERAHRGSAPCRLLVVIDEVRDLIMSDRRIKPALAAIAQIGRAVGVHLVVTTQQPSARALGEALVNFPARLLGRVATATLTYGAAGRTRTMAESLLGNGDFLLLAAGRQVRLQVPLITGEHIRALPQVAEVPRLELGEFVDLAALAGDPRGGWNRRELDWQEIEAYLSDDRATVSGLAEAFGINHYRADSVWRAFHRKGAAWPP